MNAAASWSPSIDWNRFSQGTVSNPMWHAFTDLVKLCHCVEHWREAARSLRMTTRPAKPLYPESIHMRKQRVDEWRQRITDCEGRMHRSAHLADDKVREMSRIAPTDEGNPDWKLRAAAALSIGISLGRARTRYKSLALDALDATELTNSDPTVIASLWLENAGYTGQLPQL
jgi:hypothetical protein